MFSGDSIDPFFIDSLDLVLKMGSKMTSRFSGSMPFSKSYVHTGTMVMIAP